MTIEILFNEVCNLMGDGQNATYLQATLPDSTFIFTSLTDTPYFAENKPDMIYIGSMTEATQRRVIEKLLPYKDRLEALIAQGLPILATGNAGEIFTKQIDYVTEGIQTEGLGIFNLTVKTDLFNRYNGKVLGQLESMTIVGFKSQFSFLYGNNQDNYFLNCTRGIGINKDSKLEGMRKNNFICTQLIGPILPLNPEFCEYFIGLTGTSATAAFKDAAMDAYHQRIAEFNNPSVPFNM